MISVSAIGNCRARAREGNSVKFGHANCVILHRPTMFAVIVTTFARRFKRDWRRRCRCRTAKKRNRSNRKRCGLPHCAVHWLLEEACESWEHAVSDVVVELAECFHSDPRSESCFDESTSKDGSILSARSRSSISSSGKIPSMWPSWNGTTGSLTPGGKVSGLMVILTRSPTGAICR